MVELQTALSGAGKVVHLTVLHSLGICSVSTEENVGSKCCLQSLPYHVFHGFVEIK